MLNWSFGATNSESMSIHDEERPGTDTAQLQDFRFTSLQADSSAGDEILIAEVSLSFAKIETVYRPPMPDGTLGNPIQTGYDITLNREV